MVRPYLTILFFLSFLAPCLPLPAIKPSFKTALPSAFIENKGQIIDQNNKPNSEVLYLLNSPGFNVQLRKNGFSYDLYRTSNPDSYRDDQRFLKSDRKSKIVNQCSIFENNPRYKSGDSNSVISYNRIDFDLLNANSNPVIETSAPSSDYMNYYTTGTSVEGATFVRNYKTVTYKNIYREVDLEFNDDESTGFKYSFIIRPGGDLSAIRLRIEGAEKIVEAENSLAIFTTLGMIDEQIPQCFYKLKNSMVELKGRFTKIGEQLFGFSVEKNIPGNATLIIDPVPHRVWGTYYGGLGLEQGIGNDICAVNHQGYVIFVGSTESASNIATSGAHQTIFGGGGNDAVLAKFYQNGQRQWVTYYGGNDNDYGYACAFDNNGNIYIGGETPSDNNIATPDAFKTVRTGWADGFLAKFTPAGVRLWGTYFGGGVWDVVTSIAVDKRTNEVYFCGNTNSPDNISTAGTAQVTYGGLEDCFLEKFTPDGQRIWGTYYGGNNGENQIASCTLDSAGRVYLAGSTFSTNNIGTPGSFLPAYAGGIDGFLARFDSSGHRLWGTYYGASHNDYFDGVGTDKDDNIYVTGASKSSDSIATTGVFQENLIGNSNAIIVKFDTNGQRLWGTYFGAGTEHASSIKIDDSAFIFISGCDSNQNSVIPSPNTYQPLYGGGIQDAFLAKFNSSGQRVWSTYYGGSDIDVGNGCAVDENDNCYLFGYTWSPDSIASSGGFQTNLTPNGNSDWFLVRFNDCYKPEHTEAVTGPVSLCKNTTGFTYSTSPVTYASGYFWSGPKGIHIIGGQNTLTVTIQVRDDAVSGNISVYAYNGCGHADTAYLAVTVHDDPVIIITGSDTVCQGVPSLFGTAPGKSNYIWSVSLAGMITSGGTSTSNTITVAWNSTGANWVAVNFTDANGCTDTLAVQHDVWVNPENPVSVSIMASINNVCEGTPVTFTATPVNGGSSPTYQWNVNGINAGTNSPNYTYTAVNGDIVECILTSSETTCITNNPATSNQVIMVINSNSVVGVSIDASANPVCSGIPVTFTATPVNGGASPTYQWKVNGIIVGTNSSTYTFNPAAGDLVTCVLTSSISTCVSNNPASSNPVIMIINPNLVVDITIAPSLNPVCSGIPVTYTSVIMHGGTAPFYQWKVNSVDVGTNSPTYTYNPASGDVISCILTSNADCTSNNPASSNTITMNVTTSPVVTFSRCNDSITTTNAKPFKLKGGIPLGGTYSGAGVTNGIFNPAVAGTGIHPITYTYTNAALCSANAMVPIVTIVPAVTTCGNPFTDIRDGKIYQTVHIGSQCWLAEDLNYGAEIPPDVHQRDNCIAEKYISHQSPVTSHPFYQWDELMQYDEVVSNQGLCPPAWHVPSKADWNILFANYINNGFAGSPLKYSGFSGFNALLSGARHMNKTWDWQGFAIFFWSSTAYGTSKAWAHGMNDLDPSVSAYPAFRNNAFPVRCIKDN